MIADNGGHPCTRHCLLTDTWSFVVQANHRMPDAQQQRLLVWVYLWFRFPRAMGAIGKVGSASS